MNLLRLMSGTVLLIAVQLFCTAAAVSKNLPDIAHYLMPGAPVFDLTISQFREKFNSTYPQTALSEYHSLPDGRPQKIINPAATQITETLYSSAALEPGTGKIKSIQITWIPVPGTGYQPAKMLAIKYMANIIQFFAPQYSHKGSQQKLEQLIKAGKNKTYSESEDGAVRFVIADHGEDGLTLAAEPLKLTLVKPEIQLSHDDKSGAH